MRIMQVIQKPQRRGAEVFACQLAEEMQRQGHAVCVLALYPYTQADRLVTAAPLQVLDGDEAHWAERVPGVQWGLLRKLMAAIETFRPDIVQVNGARTVKYGAFARRFERNRGWKLVYRVMGNPGYWVTGSQRKLFYRTLVMPYVGGIVAVSNEAQRQIETLYGKRTPITTIPQAVDTRAFCAARPRVEVRASVRTPDDAPVALFVGSLSAEKRPDRFLRVVNETIKVYPALRAWMIGDGPLRGALEEQVSHTPALLGHVQFLGVRADVADYMGAADVLLLTSDTEGVPGVVLEAGWMGLPVVASRVGGVPECVVDGETGLLADAGAEDGYVAHVLSLLADGRMRRCMGDAAHAWIGARFSLDILAQRFVETYEDVLM